jgi:isoleucyl-tRNA synthetase
MELGGFYLDVIKDRQYTTQPGSLARRSTQTAMYHILEMLSRLIAPILCYTADEIWNNIPGDRVESVFLSDFDAGAADYAEAAEFSDEFWRLLIRVKTAVNKELEVKRADKTVGSGLSAEIDLYCADDLVEQLQRLGDELRFTMIASRVTVLPLEQADDDTVATEVAGLHLRVSASVQPKCGRCWHHREDVGSHDFHPQLCQRCIDNIEGSGEQRSFA